MRCALLDAKHDIASDHHAGEALLVARARRRLAHHPAVAHDGDPVGERHDLVELVGDDDDREPLVDELANDLEELGDLLWSQNRGGFVEDEDPASR